MNTQQKALQIESAGIIPVFYHTKEEISLKVIELCYHNNIRVFEFTNRGENALSVFTRLKQSIHQHFPDMLLGAGTITTLQQAESFLLAGADFIVSPIHTKQLSALHNQTLYIPAGATVSELFHAYHDGARIVKVFPADVLQPKFLAHVRSVLPQIKLMPTGGITPAEAELRKWFTAGACCVGMGSALFSANLLENMNWAVLNQRIQDVVGCVAEIRSGLPKENIS